MYMKTVMWGQTSCFQLKQTSSLPPLFGQCKDELVQLNIADFNIAVVAATETVRSRKKTYCSVLTLSAAQCVVFNRAEKVLGFRLQDWGQIKWKAAFIVTHTYGQVAPSNNNLSCVCVFACSCSTRPVTRAPVQRSTPRSLRGPSCSPSNWRRDATWSSETDAVRCARSKPITSQFFPATRKCSEQTDHFTRWQVNAAVIVYHLFVCPCIACERWQLAHTDTLSALYYRDQSLSECFYCHFIVGMSFRNGLNQFSYTRHYQTEALEGTAFLEGKKPDVLGKESYKMITYRSGQILSS